MHGSFAAALGIAALASLQNRTPEEIEESRRRSEEYHARRAAEEAARHPATKRKERSASLDRILGKSKKTRY